MRDRTLLWVGLGLVLLGLLGPLLAGSGTFGAAWPMGPGMHGPWEDHDEPDAAPIPGAPVRPIRGTDFRFVPDTITVTAGEPVNIEFRNDGSVFHDLVIDELGFHLGAAPGSVRTGGLVVDVPGTYRFSCTVPGHAQAGMVGTLRVVER